MLRLRVSDYGFQWWIEWHLDVTNGPSRCLPQLDQNTTYQLCRANRANVPDFECAVVSQERRPNGANTPDFVLSTRLCHRDKGRSCKCPQFCFECAVVSQEQEARSCKCTLFCFECAVVSQERRPIVQMSPVLFWVSGRVTGTKVLVIRPVESVAWSLRLREANYYLHRLERRIHDPRPRRVLDAMIFKRRVFIIGIANDPDFCVALNKEKEEETCRDWVTILITNFWYSDNAHAHRSNLAAFLFRLYAPYSPIHV